MNNLSEEELSRLERNYPARNGWLSRLIAEVRESRARGTQEAEAFQMLTCPNCGCVCEITVRNDNRDGPSIGPIVPVFACNACGGFEWRNFLSEDIECRAALTPVPTEKRRDTFPSPGELDRAGRQDP